MDLNLEALLGVTYFVPIAITLRKVYSPDFDMPEAFLRVLGQLDASKMNPAFVSHFSVASQGEHARLG